MSNPESGPPSAPENLDEYKTLLGISDPKVIYSIIASDIMRVHFNTLLKNVLLILGLPSLGAFIVGAFYILEVIPDQAQAKAYELVQTNLMKSIENEKEAVDKKRDELALVLAQATVTKDNANATVTEIKNDIGDLSATRDKLTSQITDLNKSLASVGTVKVRDVIARLGSASNGELDALASLTPKDSLLLTLGPCASPWVPFTVGAPGAVLAVAQPPNKAGTTNQSTASVLLTAEHLPPSMGGKAQAVKLTIPGLSFDDKKVDLKRGGYEISRCGLSHCDNDVHFHDVPATLVTASTDTTLGQKPVVSPEKKLFVNLCRLSR